MISTWPGRISLELPRLFAAAIALTVVLYFAAMPLRVSPDLTVYRRTAPGVAVGDAPGVGDGPPDGDGIGDWLGDADSTGVATGELIGDGTTNPAPVEAPGVGLPAAGAVVRARTRTRKATTISPMRSAPPPARDERPGSGASRPRVGSRRRGMERASGHRSAAGSPDPAGSASAPAAVAAR